MTRPVLRIGIVIRTRQWNFAREKKRRGVEECGEIVKEKEKEWDIGRDREEGGVQGGGMGKLGEWNGEQ
jgi:hypothetical protein